MEAQTSDEKLWAGLSYAGMILLTIPAVAIYLLKRQESRYIAFHSLQAIFVWLAVFVINIAVTILTFIPVIGLLAGLASFVLFLGMLGYWVFLMVQGFTGKDYRVPVLADWIDNNLMK